MKKKFENDQSILGIYAFFFLLVIFSIFYLLHGFYKTYILVSATVTNYDTMEMVVDSDTLSRLNKNKTIYVGGKLHTIKIENVVRDIFLKENISYHQVQFTIKLTKRYRLLDVVTVTLYNGEKPLITIFQSCWKGEQNAKVK